MRVDLVYQNEWKEKQDGVKNPDNGGMRVLAGPGFSIGPLPRTSVFASILFPAYQDLGGASTIRLYLDSRWKSGLVGKGGPAR